MVSALCIYVLYYFVEGDFLHPIFSCFRFSVLDACLCHKGMVELLIILCYNTII